MGACYIAIGDHDLTVDEIVRLPVRFAPLALRLEQHSAAVETAIRPVAEPPPPLRGAQLWTLGEICGCSVVVGRRSFVMDVGLQKITYFLMNPQARAEVRRVSRAIAEVLGARRLVCCTDFNSDWAWTALERGDRVQDIISFLVHSEQQRLVAWDKEYSKVEVLSDDFNPPFFVDEWV